MSGRWTIGPVNPLLVKSGNLDIEKGVSAPNPNQVFKRHRIAFRRYDLSGLVVYVRVQVLKRNSQIDFWICWSRRRTWPDCLRKSCNLTTSDQNQCDCEISDHHYTLFFVIPRNKKTQQCAICIKKKAIIKWASEIFPSFRIGMATRDLQGGALHLKKSRRQSGPIWGQTNLGETNLGTHRTHHIFSSGQIRLANQSGETKRTFYFRKQ